MNLPTPGEHHITNPDAVHQPPAWSGEDELAALRKLATPPTYADLLAENARLQARVAGLESELAAAQDKYLAIGTELLKVQQERDEYWDEFQKRVIYIRELLVERDNARAWSALWKRTAKDWKKSWRLLHNAREE